MNVQQITHKLQSLDNRKFIISFQGGHFTLKIDRDLILAFSHSPKLEIPVVREVVITFSFDDYVNRAQSPEYSFLKDDIVFYNLNPANQILWNDLYGSGFSFDIMQIFTKSYGENLKENFFPVSETIRTSIYKRFSAWFILKKELQMTYTFSFAKESPANHILENTPIMQNLLDCVANAVYGGLYQLKIRAENEPAVKQALSERIRQREGERIISEIEEIFVPRFFTYGASDILFRKSTHAFVVSKTADHENYRLGWLGERALYNYLITNFQTSSILRLVGHGSTRFDEAKFEVNWHNKVNESGKPYDMNLDFACRYANCSFRRDFRIEVKTTRLEEESIFYFSLNEAEYMVNNDDYLVARITFMKDGGNYFGIRIHDEFFANFYTARPDTIQEIRRNLVEWKEHYGANEIRLTLNHFEPVGSTTFSSRPKIDYRTDDLPF